MATTVSPSRDTELIDLQQQVARLQALLEATRQVHSTTSLEQVLQRVLEIVVRELEMPGASFTDPPLSYGVPPPATLDGCIRFPLRDKEDALVTELVVVAVWRARSAATPTRSAAARSMPGCAATG